MQALVKTEESPAFSDLILYSTYFKDLGVLHRTLSVYMDSLCTE